MVFRMPIYPMEVSYRVQKAFGLVDSLKDSLTL